MEDKYANVFQIGMRSEGYKAYLTTGMDLIYTTYGIRDETNMYVQCYGWDVFRFELAEFLISTSCQIKEEPLKKDIEVVEGQIANNQVQNTEHNMIEIDIPTAEGNEATQEHVLPLLWDKELSKTQCSRNQALVKLCSFINIVH
jgi:hypothetical protein